jgi:signal peptidase I
VVQPELPVEDERPEGHGNSGEPVADEATAGVPPALTAVPAAEPPGTTYEVVEYRPAAVDRPAPDPRPRAPQALARVGEELLAWLKTLVSAAVYATLIVTFGFQVARVEGQSMAPTLEDQDRLIVNKLAYRLHDPRVGDIVMLLYPEDPSKSFVKRIVGEPLDTIREVNGRVYRNDVPLPDDFIPAEFRDNYTWGPEVIPQGYYFVMGDHRNNSSDSRTWKFVPKKYIIGRVQLRWWPISQARMFEDWN